MRSVLTAALPQNFFISTMVKNVLKSNAKSAPNYLTFTTDLLIKQNSGVHIAIMLYSFGNNVKIAIFINATMITAQRLSTI